MSLILKKGENMSLSKESPNLRVARVGLGWDARDSRGSDFDLDASAILLDSTGKVMKDNDLVFYNNLKHPSGSVYHSGDNRTGEGEGDDETIFVDFSKIPTEVVKIVFVVTIYDHVARKQNFGMVQNAFIRVVDDSNNTEITRFDLSEDASSDTTMVFGELYLRNSEWKFRAIGQCYAGDLGSIARTYGVNIN